IARFLRKVHMYSDDYITFLDRFQLKKGDFVFLDPPYSVECVDQYYTSCFDTNEYRKLARLCDKLDKLGVKWLLTLNSHKTHLALFKKYKIHHIRRHSFISNGMNKDKELFITNY